MLSFMVSLISTTTLGGDCLFPEYSIGYSKSITRGGMINDRDVSERYEGYWYGEELFLCFLGLYGEFGGGEGRKRVKL